LFGEISDGVVRLNEFGKIARNEWFEIEKHRPNVELDAFVVMPNHVHGIVFLKNTDDVGECSTKTRRARRAVPLRQEQFGKPTKGSITTIIRAYKSAVSKMIHQSGYAETIWQRNYYEHIIRDEFEYQRIYSYIENNPFNWREDEMYCLP
jgi:REP element-mobilizing transposase RayT